MRTCASLRIVADCRRSRLPLPVCRPHAWRVSPVESSSNERGGHPSPRAGHHGHERPNLRQNRLASGCNSNFHALLLLQETLDGFDVTRPVVQPGHQPREDDFYTFSERLQAAKFQASFVPPECAATLRVSAGTAHFVTIWADGRNPWLMDSNLPTASSSSSSPVKHVSLTRFQLDSSRSLEKRIQRTVSPKHLSHFYNMHIYMFMYFHGHSFSQEVAATPTAIS